jgi:hypothetical protein
MLSDKPLATCCQAFLSGGGNHSFVTGWHTYIHSLATWQTFLCHILSDKTRPFINGHSWAAIVTDIPWQYINRYSCVTCYQTRLRDSRHFSAAQWQTLLGRAVTDIPWQYSLSTEILGSHVFRHSSAPRWKTFLSSAVTDIIRPCGDRHSLTTY